MGIGYVLCSAHSAQYLITLFSSSATLSRTLSVISKVPKDSMFCHECQMVIKVYLYPNHMKEAHNWSNCEICGLTLSEGKKIDHIQEFHSKAENCKGLECDYCTNGLKNDQLRACTNDILFVCRFCNEGFFEIRNQILHNKRVHLELTSVFSRGRFLSNWKMKSGSKF